MERKTPRTSKQVRELMQWLNHRLDFVEQIIVEAHESHNYGKETEYLGMKSAYKECLKRLAKRTI